MKKLLAALLVAVSLSGLEVLACGGMTALDPPSLQIDTGAADAPIESILDEIDECLVIA